MHRHLHYRRHSVWADREELEAWWRQRGTGGTAAENSNGPCDEAGLQETWTCDPPALPATWTLRRAVPVAAALVLAAATSGSTGRATTLQIETAVTPIGSIPGAAHIEVLGLQDLNGDGTDDLVVRPDPSREILIYFGPSTETRRTPDVRVTVSGQHSVRGAPIGDVDGDGLGDLAVTVVYGDPETYDALSFADPHARLTGRRLAVGDFDGDGGVDVALDVERDRFGLLRPALPLSMEIRPNASPNVLVPGGVVAIAVSSRGVPLSDLDLPSLRAAGVSPSHMSWSDGHSGLQLYFDVNSLRVRPNATRLAVVGRTRSGVPVFGADAIVVRRRA